MHCRAFNEGLWENMLILNGLCIVEYHDAHLHFFKCSPTYHKQLTFINGYYLVLRTFDAFEVFDAVLHANVLAVLAVMVNERIHDIHEWFFVIFTKIQKMIKKWSINYKFYSKSHWFHAFVSLDMK